MGTSATTERKPRGLAFKVTYNDGGNHGGLVGYQGVCSDRTIFNNVRIEKKRWCSNPENQCRQYCDSDQTGWRPTSPCYESGLLSSKPFKFWTGYYHKGSRANEPIPIKKDRIAVGDIVLLTTRTPQRKEQDRIVFACYKVGKVGRDDGGHYVESDGTMDLVLPDDIATNCRYWDYQQKNKDGSINWGSGLFRYLDGAATFQFINDLRYRLDGMSERDTVVRSFGDSIEFDPRRSAVVGHAGSGEGEEHRRLKEFIAENPESVNLPTDSIASVEYRFLSGDRVDVKFDLPNGNAAVVEVETIVPLPGAHQALKYQTLLRVERLEKLGSKHVKAILVAHRFDDETRFLATKYGIELVQLKL